DGEARLERGRDPPPGRTRRDRRAERRDRRLGRASSRSPRGVPRGDRHAEGDDSALEERGLRGRRGMDRPRIMMDGYRDDRPIHPKGTLKRSLERAGGLAVAIGGAALKFGFVFAKFFGFFFSVAAYSFWFHSWTFAL